MASLWFQRQITLGARSRGVHLVTREILGQLDGIEKIDVGLAHLFIQHTSASLALNENADPDVRHDVEEHLNRMVPENAPYYRHTMEGPDDMPAHIKAMLFGSALTIPVGGGGLLLGTWQGIYLCEHRNRAGGRRVVVTVMGEGR